MRIRLTELKRIIRSEVRRALHEDPAAGMVGAEAEEPTPEDIAAARKAVESIIAQASGEDASGEDAEAVADLLPESLSSRRVLRSKEHYYNRIIRKSLNEWAVGGIVGSILAALIASNILPVGSDPAAITALVGAGGAAGSMLGKLLHKFATNMKIVVRD